MISLFGRECDGGVGLCPYSRGMCVDRGSILLFGMGIFLGHKAQGAYTIIGPFYGYFESFWLIVLLISGAMMATHHQLWGLSDGSDLARFFALKLYEVASLTLLTLIHLWIAFATHLRTRTPWQQWISRAASLGIFALNLVILFHAIALRGILE